MSAGAFKAARDFLFTHRSDYRAAHAGFSWPHLESFNYALDWFDAELVQGDNAKRLALNIVGDGAAAVTFGELSNAPVALPTDCALSASRAETASC